MVAFSHLTVALSAVTPLLAAPTESDAAPVQKRGPFDFVLGPDHPLSRRSSTNYDQDYTTGGTVSFYPASGEFYVAWDTTDDFVVGVGWNPGSTEYETTLPPLSPLPSSLPIDLRY